MRPSRWRATSRNIFRSCSALIDDCRETADCPDALPQPAQRACKICARDCVSRSAGRREVCPHYVMRRKAITDTAVRKAFALSSVPFPCRPAVTYPQVLHQAIDCFAFGTRSAQANCFNHVRIFCGITLRTSRRFIFHEAPNLSLAMVTYLPLSALVLGALAGPLRCTDHTCATSTQEGHLDRGARPAPILVKSSRASAAARFRTRVHRRQLYRLM